MIAQDKEISVSEEALYAKVAWRIIPVLFASYIAAYLDRVNVSFGKLQMQADGWVTDLTKRSDYGLYVIAAAVATGAIMVLLVVPRPERISNQ